MAGSQDYEIVVGLEVHAQLNTKSKLFCSDSTVFGLPPNTQVSVVSLGHPGTLPVMNSEAITRAVKLGIACNCTLVKDNYFARKNYFYPDLPKGYQISQHTTPICRDGFLEINLKDAAKKIRINRIHIEEDAGKSMHDAQSPYSNIDYNRAGMPLLEIVTEPDIRSAEEAFEYVSRLRKLVRHLDICDGNMEEGSLRCDVNISVRPMGETKLGTRVEIKNLNSIRFIKKAIEFESGRLVNLHRNGQTILQETRGLNEADFTTYSIRTKEDEEDYRYFPEPDLPPFHLTDEFIASIRQAMPPLPEAVKERLVQEFDLTANDATQLAEDTDLTRLFYETAAHTSCFKQVANWLTGPIKNHFAATDLPVELFTNTRALALTINRVAEGKVNYGLAVQHLLPLLVQGEVPDIDDYIEKNDLSRSASGDELDEFITEALNRHADKIEAYKKGKKGLVSVFVGEVMKKTKGRADARMITEKIIEKLK